MPWFGTIVAASALGCQIVYYPYKQDPAANPRFYPVQTAEDVQPPADSRSGERRVDAESAGLPATYEAQSFLPVGITDFQGPLTTANQLMGYDKLIYLMHDHPNVTHELMDKVTEGPDSVGEETEGGHRRAVERVHRRSASVYGQACRRVVLRRRCGADVQPRCTGSSWCPTTRVSCEAFGGGCVHYCGNATHHADNFLATKGLLSAEYLQPLQYPLVCETQVESRRADRLICL